MGWNTRQVQHTLTFFGILIVYIVYYITFLLIYISYSLAATIKKARPDILRHFNPDGPAISDTPPDNFFRSILEFILLFCAF